MSEPWLITMREILDCNVAEQKWGPSHNLYLYFEQTFQLQLDAETLEWRNETSAYAIPLAELGTVEDWTKLLHAEQDAALQQQLAAFLNPEKKSLQFLRQRVNTPGRLLQALRIGLSSTDETKLQATDILIPFLLNDEPRLVDVMYWVCRYGRAPPLTSTTHNITGLQILTYIHIPFLKLLFRRFDRPALQLTTLNPALDCQRPDTGWQPDAHFLAVMQNTFTHFSPAVGFSAEDNTYYTFFSYDLLTIDEWLHILRPDPELEQHIRARHQYRPMAGRDHALAALRQDLSLSVLYDSYETEREADWATHDPQQGPMTLAKMNNPDTVPLDIGRKLYALDDVAQWLCRTYQRGPPPYSADRLPLPPRPDSLRLPWTGLQILIYLHLPLVVTALHQLTEEQARQAHEQQRTQSWQEFQRLLQPQTSPPPSLATTDMPPAPFSALSQFNNSLNFNENPPIGRQINPAPNLQRLNVHYRGRKNPPDLDNPPLYRGPVDTEGRPLVKRFKPPTTPPE